MTRSLFKTTLYFVLLAAPWAIRSQTIVDSAFFAKAQQATSASKTLDAITLNATAEWIAGSTHETGTAQLKANKDGSSSFQLETGKASRTESQDKIDASRTCQWVDPAGTIHEVTGLNCMAAISWFAPSLLTVGAAQLPRLLGRTDDGEIPVGSSTFHQISYRFGLQGIDTKDTARLVQASTVKVLYDPQTSLPVSLEYAIHSDSDDFTTFDVMVVFTDYRPVSGVMLPFRIERYVQRSLQLKLVVTSASVD